jgi:hypothetical protein
LYTFDIEVYITVACMHSVLLCMTSGMGCSMFA